MQNVLNAPKSYHFFSFGRNETNLEIAIQMGAIGSEIGKIESYISQGSIIFLHCKSRIIGIATVTSNYFYSDDQIWPDRTYPHRFKFQMAFRFNKPVNLATTNSRDLFKTRFGGSWAPKFLFSPQPIPEDIGKTLLSELIAINDR